ncbi:MAG: hypothetical protein GVY23_09020, partial [Spirochaetes bacterium]|nr:hypothetical protein [Spirochaetota bacterium]
MTAEDFLQLRNCGVKMAGELVSYAEWLKSRVGDEGDHGEGRVQDGSKQPELFGSEFGTRSGPPLRKKSVAFLVESGLKPDDPAEWDLDQAMDQLGARSSLLSDLADRKVRWFLDRFAVLEVEDHNVRKKRFPPERLIELYCTHRDIPFVSRLCGLEISEGTKRLKRLRSWLPKLDAIHPGHLESEMEALLPVDPRGRDILMSRNVPWGLTLEELGERHALTRERVRQLEVRERKYILERYQCVQRQLTALPKVADAIRREGQQLSRER